MSEVVFDRFVTVPGVVSRKDATHTKIAKIFDSTCPRKCFFATEYTEKHGRIQKNKEKSLLIFFRDFHS